MPNMDNPGIAQIVDDLAKASKSYAQHEQGAREKILSLAYALATAVELPSETIQRIGWAEVELQCPT